MANLISSKVLPIPEKTIFLGFIPALRAIKSSPFETTSAPIPNLFISFKIWILELDFTEKHIKGLIDLKLFLKFWIFFFNWLNE